MADPDGAAPSAVPPPPSAPAPGPLRIRATLSATAGQPLPAAAAALRSALLTAAARRLGLVVSDVDLRVTELLETVPEAAAPPAEEVHGTHPEDAAGRAAAAVPGVATLTGVLGKAVHTGADHVRVELATEATHRALDVARAVRGAVSEAVGGRPPVAVLITAVVSGPEGA